MQRKGRLLLLLILVLGLLPTGAVTVSQQAEEPPVVIGEFAPGRLLVRFGEEVRASAAADVLSAHSARYVRHLYASEVQLVEVPEGQELALAVRLSHTPGVVYAEPDYRYWAFAAPNDPHYSKQWAHTERLQSAAAWDIHTGSAAVIIAVIDSGVDTGHPDLAGKIVPGYDFVAGDNDPRDENGHGTHVAGIAAAMTNNGVGVAGMSWGARIMPIRVLDAGGGGWSSDIVNGINWAYTNGAKCSI